MLSGDREQGPYRPPPCLRNYGAWGWPRVVEGVMYEAIQKEEHDQHRAGEESQELLRSH
jgi:hypothetical protein